MWFIQGTPLFLSFLFFVALGIECGAALITDFVVVATVVVSVHSILIKIRHTFKMEMLALHPT